MAVLLSIVTGLGITRLLSAFAGLMERRDRVTLDPLALTWAGVVLLYHVNYWWVAVGNARDTDSWTFFTFGALFLYAVALFFAAAIVLPSRIEDGLDLRERYEAVRRPFFTIWLTVTVMEVLDTFVKGGVDRIFVELGPAYVGSAALGGALAAGALTISDRRYHWVVAVYSGGIFTAWLLTNFGTL